MFRKAKEILQDLKTYKVASALDKHYSFTPTSGAINVDHLVNGKPYWEDTQAGETRLPKKLIITDWDISYLETQDTSEKSQESYLADLEKFWRFILSENIECYVWTGELVKVTDISDLMDCLKRVKLINRTDALAEAAKKGLVKDSIEVLDFERVQRLMYELRSLYKLHRVGTENPPLLVPFRGMALETEEKKKILDTIPENSNVYLELHYYFVIRFKESLQIFPNLEISTTTYETLKDLDILHTECKPPIIPPSH